MFLSKIIFSVSCSLWAGGLQFSKKINDKDIPQENQQSFKKSYLAEHVEKHRWWSLILIKLQE